MITFATNAALILLSISVLLLGYRLWKGPSTSDRIVALDTLGVNIVAIITVVAIRLEQTHYFPIVIVIAIISFMGTVALAKYRSEGVIIDRNRE